LQEVLSDAGHLDELMRASSSGGSFQAITPQQQQQQQMLLLPNSIPSGDGRAATAADAANGSQLAGQTNSSTVGPSLCKGDVSPSEVTITSAEAATIRQQQQQRGGSSMGRGGECVLLAGGMASRSGAAAAAAAAAGMQGKQQQQQLVTEEEAMQLVEDELQQQLPPQQQQQLPHEQQLQLLQQLQQGLQGKSASGSGENAPTAAVAAAAAAALVTGGSSNGLLPEQQAAVDWYINRFYNSFKDKQLGTIGSCRSTEDLEHWACGRLQGRSSRADRHTTEDRDKQISFEHWRAANAASSGTAAAAAAAAGSASGRVTGSSDGGSAYGRAARVLGSGAGTESDVEERLMHGRTTRDTLFEDIEHLSQQQQQQQAGSKHRPTQETLLEEDMTHLVQQQQQQQQRAEGGHGHVIHHVAFMQPSVSGSGSGSGLAGLLNPSRGGAAVGSHKGSDAAASALLEQLKIAEVSKLTECLTRTTAEARMVLLKT
jgi:hypothetical protein